MVRWLPYVPVAQRRKMAEREIAKLRKNGLVVAPVIIEGRPIVTTFWGKAWCDNLESYLDYENRLARGRTYVRNGSVIDLRISALEIKAKVSGSSIYNVTVAIEALPAAQWRSICEDCAGGIDSLVELLQGRFSKGVMERICRQDRGLFPRPSEIRFSCTCPDGAHMCKHVAATLYGVGARLDEKPELLFRLRALDENDLVADLDAALPFSRRPVDSGKVLVTDDIAALFALDMEQPGEQGTAECIAPDRGDRKAQKRLGGKRLGRTPSVPPDPAAVIPRQDEGMSPPTKAPTAPPPMRVSRSRKPRQALSTSAPAKDAPCTEDSPAVPGKAKGTKKRKAARPAMELTPDGFVKWWK